ncbi:MAG: xerD [Acidimicrobiales bacterium]|nr:xerD [Acidimicrobiales bacterium]
MPTKHSKPDGLLDAIMRVQTAVEKNSTQTGTRPVRVSQTLGRRPTGTQNKGKTWKPTPPTMEEGYAIIEALRRPDLISTKWRRVGLRNAGLVATIWRSGLRIHEGLALRPGDIDRANSQVHVIRGKGGKERWSVIDGYGLEQLDRWMKVRDSLGFNNTQPIFCVIEGSSKGGQMAASYVRVKLYEAARMAGVDKRVVPHQWRHAHALHLHRQGVPLAAISRQLGHSNTSTTDTYLSGMGSEEIRELVLDAWAGQVVAHVG